MRHCNTIAFVSAFAVLLCAPRLSAQSPPGGAASVQATAPGMGMVANAVEIVRFEATPQ